MFRWKFRNSSNPGDAGSMVAEPHDWRGDMDCPMAWRDELQAFAAIKGAGYSVNLFLVEGWLVDPGVARVLLHQEDWHELANLIVARDR